LEAALMSLRKKTIQIIALTLALSLVGVSAVPAKTACARACCCKTPSQIPVLDPTSLSRITHHLKEHERMQEGSYRVSGYFFLKNSSPEAQDCRVKTGPAACGMEPLDRLQVLYGAIHSVPRASHGPVHATGTAAVAVAGKDLFPFRPAAETAMITRAGPSPLYLQNLSLLI